MAKLFRGQLLLRLQAAPMPDSPAPMINTSKCSNSIHAAVPARACQLTMTDILQQRNTLSGTPGICAILAATMKKRKKSSSGKHKPSSKAAFLAAVRTAQRRAAQAKRAARIAKLQWKAAKGAYKLAREAAQAAKRAVRAAQQALPGAMLEKRRAAAARKGK
jgi:hypothetical protein